MTTVTASLAAFGESTFRGWGADVPSDPAARIAYDKDNANMVPKLAAQHFGLGLSQTIANVNNVAVSGTSFADQSQAMVTSVAGYTVPGPVVPANLAGTHGTIALLNMGINDAFQGNTVGVFQPKLESVINNLRRSGRYIVLQSPNQLNNNPTYRDGSMYIYEPTMGRNVTLTELVNQYANVYRAEVGANGYVFSDANALSIPIVTGDYFHPTDAGYVTMGQHLHDVMGDAFVAKVTRETQVALLYTAVFMRSVEASGVDFWVSALAGGSVAWADGSLATQLLNASSLYPSSFTDTQFVQAVYTNVFGRAAQPSDISYWTGQLAGGYTRGRAMVEMLYGGLYYLVNGGTDPVAINSCNLIHNRLAVSMAYGAIFRKSAVDAAYPSGTLSGVTTDPATVLTATAGF